MPTEPPFADLTIEELREIFQAEEYVAEEKIVTTVQLALQLGKPLIIEGQPGAGKTELAKVLASGFDTDLIRLQCYEGLTAENALYEWNYTKQLLAVQGEKRSVTEQSSTVFEEEFLLERPLLEALQSDGDSPPVLLIDEIDRADEEFEALLLEMLSDFQITIPEFGTVSATTPPIVVITSNRTRSLGDALTRRCLYLHVEPPSLDKELEIVRRKVPQLDSTRAAEICGVTRRLREESLLKPPGVAETLDFGRAIAALSSDTGSHLDRSQLQKTMGTVLKQAEDTERIDEGTLGALLDSAADARAKTVGETDD